MHTAAGAAYPELPTMVNLVASLFPHSLLASYLLRFEAVFFASLVGVFLVGTAYCASKAMTLVPSSVQNVWEICIETLDIFVCGLLGPHGRRYIPFLGTLFFYILGMNLIGLIPFCKSPTSSLSTTLVLGLCVFCYVHYAAIRTVGIRGYIDHLMGKPRGPLALSIILPLFMFFLHVVSELIKPLTLSLRLRSNVWGDDLLLAFLAGFGIKGIPLLLFNTLFTLIAGIVQATVFFLLATVYFGVMLDHE